ncbi:MAG TPA: DUF4835 family protein [Candidatus Limisoma intestinavium]|uniref:DUF4835 family protein n=1 Tax=Candidatus Limisoma intestinavium TaxID=2840856 RepID=A0A9D1IL91_9BACT|nr:DUF4835 family protein [Candidatus Limisoma intestinavium]
MKRIRIKTLLCLLALGAMSAAGQELNCSVEVNSDKISGTDKSVFTTLQTAITEYMNNTQWGNAQFLANERIECKLFFTISSYDGTTMSGDLQIQSTRPVYNSTYTTTLINFKDENIEFDYQENEPLIFSENSMESELTAILNYYAYLILAIDFDSFSPNGGESYYEKAANVVNMAQSSGGKGWKAFEDNRNRSAVLSAFTDPSTKEIRTLLYDYHRKGLDEMVLSPDKGKSVITKSLEILKQIYDVNPMSVALSMFKDAKLDELVNVYSKSNMSERQSVYELLYPLYPTERERLDKIKEEQQTN